MPRKPAPARSRPTADVETLLAELDHPLATEISQLRAMIRGADPRIAEGIKWNAPSFHTTEHFATFHLRARDAIQVVLHLGAKPRPDASIRGVIADPAALLEWRGADRAIVTFCSQADVESKRDAFVALVRQWIEFVE